jgi:tRNA(Ile)-lysidine synthase
VVLACSAGPDSSALAVLVRHARPDLVLLLAYVAHALRGPQADADEAARVAALAGRLGATHAVLPVTVVSDGAGVEAAARDARHAALEVEAARVGAAAVLLAHHADDQAETVLLRLARGTGPDGLAGMASAAGVRVRPLLEVRRTDVHRAARELAPGVVEDAAHDPMNDDLAFARVRVRRDVLPALAGIGPDPVGALVRLAALVRDESAVLDATVADLLPALGLVTVGRASAVPSDRLRALPDALARRVLRVVLAGHGGPPAADTLERILRGPDGWRATLPGPLEVEVGHGWHVLAPSPSAPGAPPAGTVADPVLEGSVRHGPSAVTVTVAPAGPAGVLALAAHPAGGMPPGLDPDRLAVRLRIGTPLGLRTRREGDRLRTSAGTRTLADLMSDARVPLVLRGLLPVVTDASDRPVWVPGLAVAAEVHDRPGGGRE